MKMLVSDLAVHGWDLAQATGGSKIAGVSGPAAGDHRPCMIVVAFTVLSARRKGQ
ncbi:hypothetical protein [Catenuloplanes japonicus]|uniref:hypothetical protein n=1 Tax=Catenuloplanes japonicus TaxID=33876 RepID=UPI000AD94387|nr:hypothetical protein [Catenuloplanes japonicus]